MFEVTHTETTIRLVGRLDSTKSEVLKAFLEEFIEATLAEPPEDKVTVVDFEELKYIASSGLGELFAAQKKLMENDRALMLINLNPHIREVFGIAGFDNFFEIG